MLSTWPPSCGALADVALFASPEMRFYLVSIYFLYFFNNQRAVLNQVLSSPESLLKEGSGACVGVHSDGTPRNSSPTNRALTNDIFVPCPKELTCSSEVTEL